MKKGIIILISFVLIFSLTCCSAGLFDNKLSCDTYEMEMLNDLSETEGNGMVDNYLGALVTTNGPYDHFVHLGVHGNSTVSDYINDSNYTIIKNYTVDNFISYMTDTNNTFAEITIDNITYVGHLSHDFKNSSSSYDDEMFKTDTEFLKKHMSTIKSK